MLNRLKIMPQFFITSCYHFENFTVVCCNNCRLTSGLRSEPLKRPKSNCAPQRDTLRIRLTKQQPEDLPAPGLRPYQSASAQESYARSEWLSTIR